MDVTEDKPISKVEGMTDNYNAGTDPDEPMIYQIRIKGHLDPQWKDWFDGMSITLEENGETVIFGPVIDQAALYGLLKKVRDIGIPLISVMQITSAERN